MTTAPSILLPILSMTSECQAFFDHAIRNNKMPMIFLLCFSIFHVLPYLYLSENKTLYRYLSFPFPFRRLLVENINGLRWSLVKHTPPEGVVWSI